MKNWFSKLLLTSLSLGILVFPFSIKAEVLNDDFDLSCLKGLKLGYCRCRMHGGLSTGAKTQGGKDKSRDAARRGMLAYWAKKREFI